MLDKIIDWVFQNWGTVISMLALGVGVRRLEIAIKHKKSNDRKEMYNRISALEIAASDQRSETKRIDQSYKELREGCITIESKMFEALDSSSRAEESVKTIISALKAKQKD